MLYSIKNDLLSVTIDTLGAQMISVTGNGCEYIWQGDEAFWTGRAPLLFPICGRLFEGKYTLDGKEYEMNLHGFARKTEFNAEKISDTEIVFSLSSSDATKAQYPFEFKLTVIYKLDGNKISSSVSVHNLSEGTMPATFGAHPGFNVPLDAGRFEDWYVEFDRACTPNRLLLSRNGLNTGIKQAMSLEGGRKIRLKHSLFEVDGVFMDNIPRSISLKSDRSERSVTLSYPDMPYLGIWQPARKEAPFVCIEPWCGLPSFEGLRDDMMSKNDTFHIAPGESKRISYEIIFN